MRRYSPLLLSLFFVVTYSAKFRVIREWKYVNFTWPNYDAYNNALSRGTYLPENNIISGINYFENYYYITLPRMKDGVPATLTRIPAGTTKDTAPALEPFPSWEMNVEGDCNGLQNVQNIEIDPKGQMWIIDSGRTETLGTPSSRCPPKLIIFDIKKNMTNTAYTFPENVASLNSNFLYGIVVDDTDSGYAYITDNSAKDPGIIVFSVKDHHSWKIRHSQSMRADPTATTFRVGDVVINAPLNLAGIALGPRIHTNHDRIVIDEDRQVFYSPISSLHLYSINTTVLRNEQNGANNGEYQGDVKDYGSKGSQSAGMIMDSHGVLYFTLLDTNSIAKWDTLVPFDSKKRIIARDRNYLEWPSAFTFDDSGNITVLVNKLDEFIYDIVNITRVNYRLISSHTGTGSYLFNQVYDYNIEANTTSTTTEDSDLPEPEVLPGSGNDPYLVPQPIPERKEPSSSPEPTDGPAAITTESRSESHHKTEPVTSPEPEPKATSEPKPEPKPKTETVPTSDLEPKSEPEPTADHGDHDHANHDHANHDHVNQTASPSQESKDKSSASVAVPTFAGIIFVCGLFFF